MIKLHLYKFLGNFIPYFKRMMLDRDEMLKHINSFFNAHANTYKNISLFVIKDGLIVESDVTTRYFKIEHVITYKNTKTMFSVFIEYFEDNITLGYDIHCKNSLFEIADFVEHFYLIHQSSLVKIFNFFK